MKDKKPFTLKADYLFYNRFWSFVKKNSSASLGGKVRRVLQDRLIRKNIARAFGRLEECGLSYSEEYIRSELSKRLARRNILPRKKGDLHICYASGPSTWDEHNIPSQLEKFGKLSLYYWNRQGYNDLASDWPSVRDRMNQDFLKEITLIHNDHPIDVLIGYFTGWNISAEFINKIKNLGIAVFSYSWDDLLSFYGRKVLGRWTGPAAIAASVDLTLVNTTDSCLIYLSEGGLSVFGPEAANPDFFRPLDIHFEYDVSFIGTKYGNRPLLIDYLRKKGVSVECFGEGWRNGRITPREMAMIYNKSRINLGFGGIGYSIKHQCLKGRDFEVPMSSGLYLTSYNPELGSCYKIGEEIVVYKNRRDCLGKIRCLLADPVSAEEIRRAGYRRALSDHTWENRFHKMFCLAGLIID